MTSGASGRRGSSILIGAILGLAGLGCSSGDERVARQPVRGKVLVKGEPAAGAFVVFHPEGAAAGFDRPRAQVRADGTFDLSTYDEADGAPVGDYAVTVEWWKSVRRGNEVAAGPNVVPARYGKAETTPLKVAVREGANDLPPFEISR